MTGSSDYRSFAELEELSRGGKTYVDKRVTERLDSTGAVIGTSKSVMQRQGRPDLKSLMALESMKIGGPRDWC